MVALGENNASQMKMARACFPITAHVLQKAWSGAIKDLGYRTSKDPIDGDTIGGSTATNAVDSSRKERSHAGVVFLEPSTKQDHFTLDLLSKCMRVLRQRISMFATPL